MRLTATLVSLLSLVGSADLGEDEIADIQSVLVDTGAVAEIETSINHLTNAAIAAIDTCPITPEAAGVLVDLAEYVAWRDR